MMTSAIRLRHLISHAITSSNPPKSFIRFYYQIPIDGTIYHSPQARAQQALTQHTQADVKALTSLYHKNCTAIPKLLGHGDRVQGVRDYVPGGYINYVVWTRVAGEPINSVPYWKRDLAYREEVRSVFRATYKKDHIYSLCIPVLISRRELQKDVWASSICCLRKLIHDEATTKSM